jgi:WD40 repeat protein
MVWQPEAAYALQEKIVAHLFTINHIAFRKEGDYFATCSKDKSIKVWENGTFRLRKVIDRGRHAGHGTSVNKVGWLENGFLLISCSDDRAASAWELVFEERS